MTTDGSLGYGDHRIVEFKFWLSILKTSNKTTPLDFRRTKFSMITIQLESTERKRVLKSFLETQEQSTLYTWKGRRQNKEHLWPNRAFGCG